MLLAAPSAHLLEEAIAVARAQLGEGTFARLYGSSLETRFELLVSDEPCLWSLLLGHNTRG